MKKRQKTLLFLMIAGLLLFLPAQIVRAAGLSIEYGGKEISYTDTQVRYSLDGEMISSLYPGIIVNGISLAPFSDIFIKPDIGITYEYNSEKKTIDLYYGNKEINFVLDSSTATVNGKKVKLPAVPRVITFSNKGTRKVYLPARFVAETFGFQYVWNSKTGVASITSPATVIRYDGRDYTYTGRKLQIETDGTAVTDKDLYGIVINDVVMAPAKQTLGSKGIGASYKYDKATKTITVKKYGITVSMQAGSTKAYIDGKEVPLPEAPRQIKFYHTGETWLYVPLQFVTEALHYEYLPFLSKSCVNLKKPYAIYYDGQWNFPSVKGSVTYNGKEVEVAPAYSYIESDNEMVAARKVFEAGLGCDFQYDSGTKHLTISYQGNTIEYTLESTEASVNGVLTTAPVAPKSVRYDKDGTFVMIPGRFTANALGFEYEWINAGSTSVISSKEQEETPDTPDMPVQEGTLFQWSADADYQSYIESQKDLTDETKLTGRTQNGTITVYTSLMTVFQTQDDQYQLYSSDGFFEVNGNLMDDGLELTLGDTVASDAVYPFAGGIVSQAAVTFHPDSYTTKVVFTFRDGAADSYRLTLSEDNRILTVQTYRTCITSVSGQREQNEDTLVIRGTNDLQAELLSDEANEDLIWLQISGAVDTLSSYDMVWTDPETAGGILAVTRIPLAEDQMQLLIQKKSEYEFYMVELGNQINLMVKKPGQKEYALKIPYMPGTDLDQITDKDLYRSCQFKITLPGDQTAYLDANPLLNTNAVITDIRRELNAEGNTVITVRTSRLQAYRIHYTSTALMIEVGDPKDVYDKIVVLDAGHGGSDPGTIHHNVKEKDLNLQILYSRLKSYFEDSDIKAYWTREDDTFISLNDRAAYARKVGADLFISLHMNSYTTGVPQGLSVYHCSQNTSVNEGGINSRKLADILQKNLIGGLKATDRKVKDNTYVVCKSNTVPAVLIELGFMSNTEEFSKLTSASYQKKTAQILYDSIVQIFQEYPTGRSEE